jgi:lysophospholipase L1-like esterase
MSATESPFATDAAAPVDARARRFRARDGVLAVAIAVVVVLVCAGPSIRHTGQDMDPGFQRAVVLAVGKPAGAVADRLPFTGWAHDVTAWLSPDDHVGGAGAFQASVGPGGTAAGSGTAGAGGAAAVAPVGPDAFPPGALGGKPPAPRALRSLLVTGDSMAMPLDADLARQLAGAGVRTDRDPHIGTGISKSDLLDWGALSVRQARARPDAVVVFIGANEGFPLPGPRGRPLECCGADWAAAYATRVRTMMNTYRRAGASRVYWLTLPLPRDRDRQAIARAVNAAIAVAAEPYRAQVRVIDLAGVFTPGGRYRVSMPVGGHDAVVRKPDGIHLSPEGAQLAADLVERDLRADYRVG